MRLTERSFPYPVVGNRDDVPGADFQATLRVVFDAEYAFATVDARTSSKTLLQLIATGKATYALHIECSNTLFREIYRSHEPAFTMAIPLSKINDSVDAIVSIVAADDISNFYVDGQHNDYGSFTFDISKGSILALYPGFRFEVDRDYSSFGSVDAIITISQTSDASGPIKVSYNDEKIVVFLSKHDFLMYGRLARSPIAPILSSTIVLPVLVEALAYLKETPDSDNRWARIILQRIGEERLAGSASEDLLLIAQELLELPIRRALLSADKLLTEVS